MVERTCQNCGATFWVKPYKVRYGEGRYCQRACANEAQKKRVPVKCECCGITFEVIPSSLKYGKGKYCSKECRTRTGAKNPRWSGGKKSHTCKLCGREFFDYPAFERKYCSQSCFYKARRKPGWQREAYLRKMADPKKKLSSQISQHICTSLTNGKSGYSWERAVGYTIEELMAHLESQFQSGMTWENRGRGGWHIDHIRPVSDFDFTSVEDPEFKECWSLWNLQPLWEKDNLRKYNRCDNPPLPLLN